MMTAATLVVVAVGVGLAGAVTELREAAVHVHVLRWASSLVSRAASWSACTLPAWCPCTHTCSSITGCSGGCCGGAAGTVVLACGVADAPYAVLRCVPHTQTSRWLHPAPLCAPHAHISLLCCRHRLLLGCHLDAAPHPPLAHQVLLGLAGAATWLSDPSGSWLVPASGYRHQCHVLLHHARHHCCLLPPLHRLTASCGW